MCKRFIGSICLGILVLTAPAWADQDDINNNADLQATPEERAKAAVQRRWPDATEIDAMDMTADEAEAPEADAMPKDDGDDQKLAGEKDEQAPAMMADEDNDEGGNWTVSVLFVCDGKKFEALTDDDGKIQYVYETIPKDNAPQEILDAARDEVKDGEIVYVQKERDETGDDAVTTYIVGVGDKDVRLDLDGNVIEVKDAPAQPDKDEDNDDDGGRKMKI